MNKILEKYTQWAERSDKEWDEWFRISQHLELNIWKDDETNLIRLVLCALDLDDEGIINGESLGLIPAKLLSNSINKTIYVCENCNCSSLLTSGGQNYVGEECYEKQCSCHHRLSCIDQQTCVCLYLAKPVEFDSVSNSQKGTK